MNPITLLALRTSAYESLTETKTRSHVLWFVLLTLIAWIISIGTVLLRYTAVPETLEIMYARFLIERSILVGNATIGVWLFLLFFCVVLWAACSVLGQKGQKPSFQEVRTGFLTSTPLVLFVVSLLFFVPLVTTSILATQVAAVLALVWSFALITKSYTYSLSSDGAQTMIAVFLSMVVTGVLGIIGWAIV